jgi:hypothetical protein
LFVVVLTMISGARELMTPGAWEKNGLTHKLKSGPEAQEARAIWDSVLANRRQRLLELKVALWSYAAANNGRFPPDDQDSGIPRQAWETPDPSRVRYVYVPGHQLAQPGTSGTPLIACEPGAFPAPLLALSAGGEIQEYTSADLRAALGRSAASTQPAGPTR